MLGYNDLFQMDQRLQQEDACLSRTKINRKAFHQSNFQYCLRGLAVKWNQFYLNIKHNSIDLQQYADEYDEVTESFQISLYYTDKHAKLIWQDVRKRVKIHGWKAMKELNLNIQSCQDITGKGIKEFYRQNDQHLPNLEKFTLSVLEDTKAKGEDNSSEQLFNMINRHLPRLTELKLGYHIRAYDKTDNLYFKISPSLKNLRTFSLQFDGDASEAWLRHMISQIAKNLVNLKHFSFRLDNCRKVTGKELEGLIYRFTKNSPQLEYLSINFQNCNQFTDDDIALILAKLNKPLLHLRHFILIIERSQQLSNRSVELIAERLVSNIPNVESLRLEFRFCKLITGESINLLTGELKNCLTCLTKLDLIFAQYNYYNYQEIFNQDLEAIGLNLSNLIHLNHLNLCFLDWKGFDGRGFLAFSEAICKNLTELTTMGLNFNGCGPIRDESMEAFVNLFKDHQTQLQRLTICLKRLKEDHSGILKLFRETCKFIPHGANMTFSEYL